LIHGLCNDSVSTEHTWKFVRYSVWKYINFSNTLYGWRYSDLFYCHL